VSLSNLAANLDDQNRHGAAERLHRRALAIWEKALPDQHWHTEVGRSALAACLDDLHRHDEAGPLHRQALAALQAGLGSTHARTAWALFRLARHQLAVGEAELGLATARRAQATLLQRSGPEHWRLRRVAAWLAEQGGT
jgi:hypothetical protein